MTSLIAIISSGKGTWGHVARLMELESWDNVVILVNDFAKDNFTHEKKFTKIVFDENKTIPELKEQFFNALKNEKLGHEVAVNFVSGSGKEHMALLAALLQLGLGIRQVVLTKEGVSEL
jgi:hypothetical protein